MLKGSRDDLLNWLEPRARWSKLRDLGQSGVVRASVLMPVFGYLLLFNDTIQQYLTIFQLPSMWKVWLLFYGSWFLAVGAIVFAWRCPAEIKQYISAYAMADAERDHRAAQKETKEVADKLRTLYARLPKAKWEDLLFEGPRLQPDQPHLGAGSSEFGTDPGGLGLIHIWRLNDIKHPWCRISAYLCFRVGIILVSIPAIVTLLQVTNILLKGV
jgi:hypothetical protein